MNRPPHRVKLTTAGRDAGVVVARVWGVKTLSLTDHDLDPSLEE